MSRVPTGISTPSSSAIKRARRLPMATPRVLTPTMTRLLMFLFLSMISVATRARTRLILTASMIRALVFSSMLCHSSDVSVP